MGNNHIIKGGIVFSGRFNPVHHGHTETIFNLAELYDRVLVVVLDYPDRGFPISYVLRVFNRAIYHSHYKNVGVITNKMHFGKLQLHEWQTFGCKYYAAGNLKVLRHMELLIGATNCVYTQRSFEYEAHKYPPPE